MENMLSLLRGCGAMLEGHFVLSSGRHSDRYFQCARLLQHPDMARDALSGVAGRIARDVKSGRLEIDAVVGPAMGGIVVAYELGRQLGLPAFFTERDDSGAMALRRGFEVRAGQKILVTEDVVTTGKSYGECSGLLESLGAEVVAIACIVDRSQGTAGFPGPFYPACRVEVATWESGDCELCAKGIPAVKPGSRKL
jgi:orotate phosphoribosyltransferase